MSVNLLPSEVEGRRTIQRRAVIAAVAVLALWLALGTVFLAERGARDRAQAERDAIAQRSTVLQAQVQSLQVFQVMADQVAQGDRLLAYAMSGEVSWAQLLVDLASGVPESASFTVVRGQTVNPLGIAGAQPDYVFVPNDAADVGYFTLNGYTTQTFTPGVQELLRRFGRIDGLFQEYLSNASLDAIGPVDVTTFAAEVRMDDTRLTGRYFDGLPEVEP